MNHQQVQCQESLKRNPNTSRFWDNMIRNSRDTLLKSPIYIYKNIQVLKHLKNKTGKLLDVGIGYGAIEKLIIEKGINKLKMYGIDISKTAVQYAKENFRGEFKKSSVLAIPYRNDFFNQVIALDVIEHLSFGDGSKALSEINRVLKVGGTLTLSVPLNETATDKIKNGHLIEYSEPRIIEKIERSGFIVRKYKLLTAFNNFFIFKNIINSVLKMRKPNLIIVTAIKK